MRAIDIKAVLRTARIMIANLNDCPDTVRLEHHAHEIKRYVFALHHVKIIDEQQRNLLINEMLIAFDKREPKILV